MTKMKTDRRGFLKIVGAGAAAFALGGASGALAAPARRKLNFVFFLIDDMGWTDLGCYGSTLYETPHIDKFAASGMRFTDAYAACPVCSPTRASIMAGKYPARLKITNYGSKPLPPGEVTLAEAFKAGGYTTFFAGKWHVGGSPQQWPDKRGFDINIGGNATGQPKGGYFSPYNNPQLPDGPKGEYLTDRLTDESLKFLDKHKSEPFLLYLSHYAVHTPLQAKKDIVAKYQTKIDARGPAKGPVARKEGGGTTKLVQDNATFAAMTHSVDDSVGRVLKKLDELGLTGNTAVIFMSDNGGLSTLKGSRSMRTPTCNVPLRAGKGWVYEGGIREPMIVRWPGKTKPGSTCAVPVISTDFYPTMLEMARMKLRPKQHCDGVSIVPLLKGEKSLNRKAIYWHYPHRHGSGSVPSAAVRCGDWKLIEWYGDKRIELFNLADDIGETKDLAKSNGAKAAELHAMLKAWRKDVGAVIPTPGAKRKKKR
jgi:arylsulfatase A-like enzyme